MRLIPFTNKKIKTIVNVYQLQYTNAPCEGFGDFLRGCFYIMQLSKMLNLKFELDISNHPIAKYIENSGKNPTINYDNLKWIQGHNRPQHLWQNPNKHLDFVFANKIIKNLNKYHATDTYALFSNAFPIFYNFLDTGRQRIKNMLIPNTFMQDYVDHTLNELKLQKNTYSTIHIRSGDKYLTNLETMNDDFINKMNNIINGLPDPNTKYLIISDSIELKMQLKTLNPNFYILDKEITHLGGQFLQSNENSDGVMNTLLDFYAMSYSNSIFALSVYGHITGFSQYCAVLNNIPFNYILLK
jgi:hypothetical protein